MKQHICTLVAALALLANAGQSSNEVETKAYISPDGRYSINYPGNWTLESRAAGFRIYNFAIGEIRPQFLLPRNGALIALGGRRRSVNSLEDWIRSNAKHRTFDSREMLRLQAGKPGSNLDVIEIATHWAEGNETFEQIDWYFSLQGELFNGQLLFYRDDPAAQVYKDTFKVVLTSLQVNR